MGIRKRIEVEAVGSRFYSRVLIFFQKNRRLKVGNKYPAQRFPVENVEIVVLRDRVLFEKRKLAFLDL